MKLNGTVNTLIGGLALFCSSVTAAPDPEVCPSAAAIKAEGVSYAYNLMLDLYLTTNGSQYDTDKSWEFAIGIIRADDEDRALAQGNQVISTLSGQPLPQEIEPGTWACIYHIADNDYLAAAFYTDFPMAPAKIKSYFHHIKH